MASQLELEWWDKFADISAIHWRLEPSLNRAIREEYTKDYNTYLFKEGGKLLEVGCGTGWMGHHFAKNGMAVDGLDFSKGQLEIAGNLARDAGLKNIEFFVRDLVKEKLNGRFEKYDSVLINAVLHHLTAEETSSLITRVAAVLEAGGKVYIYEPLVPVADNGFKFLLMNIFTFFFKGLFFIVRKSYGLFGLMEPEFIDAIKMGYTGTSPDEKPVDFQFLSQCCRQNGLNMVKITPYHHFSIAFGVSIIQIRNPFRAFLAPLAGPIYRIEKWLFSVFGWNNLLSKNQRSGKIGMNRAVLCGMQFSKVGQTG